MKTLFVRNVPEKLHREVKIHAARKGVTVREAAIDLLQVGVSKRLQGQDRRDSEAPQASR